MNEQIRKTTEKALERFRSAVILKNRSPSKWATEERIIPQGGPLSSGGSVKYSHEFMPHCVEQMDSADNPDIRLIVIWAAIRDGKTSSCLNIFGRTVTDDPGNIYSVHPTDDDVAKFSNDDIEPMIDLCPALDARFVKKKSRDSGRTVNFKKYIGGSLRIVSAGSITKFRGSTVRVLFLHEADALELESIYKALGRTEGLSDAIIVMESTGTIAPTYSAEGKIEYHSVIHEHYEKGDMRKWFCKCKSCGALQWLKYEQLKWPAGKMEEAKYHCECCDAAHNEKEWRKMASQGKWYPTAGLSETQLADIANSWQKSRAKQPEIRSYWRNGFNSLLPKGKGFKTKLHEFVAKGEAAKSSQEALKTWTNEVAAELWDSDERTLEPPSYQAILDNREDYATRDEVTGEERIIIPQRAMILTNSTDLHGDRLEVNWTAWAKDEESWNLKQQVIWGNTERREVWQEWKSHLQTKFLHESGHMIGMSWGLIDSNWRIDPVLVTLGELRIENVPGVSGLLRMSRGIGKPDYPVLTERWGTIAKKAKGVIVGTWAAKTLIYERLRAHTAKEKGGPGFIHFGKNTTDESIRQAVAEKATVIIFKGREIEKWENKPGTRNEVLDLLVYNLAAFRFNKWDWDAMELRLVPKTSAPKEEELEEKSEEPRKNWITGGAKW